MHTSTQRVINYINNEHFYQPPPLLRRTRSTFFPAFSPVKYKILSSIVTTKRYLAFIVHLKYFWLKYDLGVRVLFYHPLRRPTVCWLINDWSKRQISFCSDARWNVGIILKREAKRPSRRALCSRGRDRVGDTGGARQSIQPLTGRCAKSVTVRSEGAAAQNLPLTVHGRWVRGLRCVRTPTYPAHTTIIQRINTHGVTLA